MRLRAELAGVVVAACGLVAAAPRAAAQAGGADVIRRGLAHGGARPPAGFYTLARRPGAFEFSHGWLEKARRVRQARQARRARGAWRQLNQAATVTPGAAAVAAPATAVGGTLRYPTFLPLFSNTSAPDAVLMDTAAVARRFWGTLPAPANPYSVTTYYQEVSGGRLTVTGTVIDTIRLPQTDTFYEGNAGCQGLCGSSGVPTLIRDLVRAADATVNFAAFADSATGYVPAVVILDPQVGGECLLLYSPAQQSIWAHRFSLSGWAQGGNGPGAYQTNDTINGHPVVIDDYIIQGGQGGQGGCTPGALAPIGTVTHETGHLFGLPDLYDTGDLTEGLGHWDLMASGNEQKPSRPAHMSAWTLATLGWVAEVPLAASQTVTTGPIETGDTAFAVPLAGTNEFFLLENRQPIGSDSMMAGPGLMIYHLDTLLMGQRLGSNSVNAIVPHALAVEEAAGDTGLNCTYPQPCNDRGDAGDPFPGTSGNTVFGPASLPAARTNARVPVPLKIDSIQQVPPSGAVRFRITFGGLTTVAASDTAARVQVDGVRTPVFRDLLASGSTHTIGIDTAQLSTNGRVGYRFTSWSDHLPAQHTITGSTAGATYTALVARRYLMNLSIIGPGTVGTTRAIDPVAGSFLTEGDSVTLTPVPEAGSAFVGWSVDTVTGAQVLALKAVRPYSLVATFAGTADVLTQLLTGRSVLTGGQVVVLDGLGNNTGRLDLGDFVAWLDRNPGALAARRGAGLRAGPGAGAGARR